tara:strand:+ start:13771 stop:14148 length:378 start_codon:yes stop_codon:yes gene_type:complete
MTKHFFQLMRFGIIGASAAAVNMFMLYYFVETYQLMPLVANIFAFLIAFLVSYFGHRHWTFREKQHANSSLPKFFMVAAMGFLLNEALFAVFLHVFHIYYMLALFITLIIVAVVTFVFSKFWAFK